MQILRNEIYFTKQLSDVIGLTIEQVLYGLTVQKCHSIKVAVKKAKLIGI